MYVFTIHNQRIYIYTEKCACSSLGKLVYWLSEADWNRTVFIMPGVCCRPRMNVHNQSRVVYIQALFNNVYR